MTQTFFSLKYHYREGSQRLLLKFLFAGLMRSVADIYGPYCINLFLVPIQIKKKERKFQILM